MQFTITYGAYNSSGGHPSISLVGEFLEMGAPNFGSAIKAIEIAVYLPNSAALKSAYERSANGRDYYRFLNTLPTFKFLRKKHRVQVGYLSKLGTAEEIRHDREPKFGLFCEATIEVERVLLDLKTKFKPSQDFNLGLFFGWIHSRVDQLPKTQAEFTKLLTCVEAFQQEKRNAMDPWEKLGIDWDEFHPKARAILNEPFFWDCTDDFAPNGNDTGADLLAYYQEWRPAHKKLSGEVFFRDLMAEWEVDSPPQGSDSFSAATFDESAIALAFTQIKIDGVCENSIRRQALEAIERQRKRHDHHRHKWTLLSNCLHALDPHTRRPT